MYREASYVCMKQPILHGAAIDLHGEQPELHGAGQFPRSRAMDLHGESVSLVGHRTFVPDVIIDKRDKKSPTV